MQKQYLKKIGGDNKKMKDSKKLISIIEFLNKFKHVERFSLVSEKGRRESDAEHTWHLVMTLWLLSEKYEKKIDLNKAIKIALVHDLPEIITGDFYAHSTEITKEEKHKKEAMAMEKIIKKFPKEFGKEVKKLWKEYEARKTEEAKFVWLADKLMPKIMKRITKGDLADNLEKDLKHKEEQNKKMKEMSKLFSELIG
jgi:putative hydrolases of HD superfamily